MMKHYLWLWVLLLCSTTSAFALKPAPVEPKVSGYVMWHEDYFLFAARVEDSMLSGSSTEQQVFPSNDDGIELCLETRDAAGKRVASRLAISVAEGFAVLTRDDSGRWRTDNSWLAPPAMLKFAVKTEGTLNNPSDVDRGFTVEVAIPWERLGGKPKALSLMGFNFLVRVRGENQAFTSWSPAIMTEDDNENASRWGSMLLIPGSRPSAAERGELVCPRTFHMPLIDGLLGAEEWLGAAVITLKKPLPEIKPSPANERKPAETPLLMAIYRYDYVNGQDKSPDNLRPINEPREGLGPWVSSPRTGWHREQLKELQRAGVEVLLADYSPAPADRSSWSRAGLLGLSEALKELRNTERYYPMVGMYLEGAGLARALGQPADLTTPHGQELVYGAIREFYQHIPPEFRAAIGDKEKGYPVVLGPPTGLANWSEEFIKFADKSFARDFSGAKLAWLADPGWKAHGISGLLAFPPLSGQQPSAFDASGRAGIAVLSPGCFDPEAGIIRPSGEGPELREEWRKMLTLNPPYVVLISWNDFARGTNLAPGRLNGLALVDTLSLLVSQAAEKVSRPIRLRRANLPAALPPGGKSTIELVLANTSAEVISTDEHLGFDMRILDDSGKKILVTKSNVDFFRLPPGGITHISIPITAFDASGNSLPRGKYLVEFILQKSPIAYLKSKWLAHNIASFRLPLRVERPPKYACTVLNSTLRNRLKSGAEYTCRLTLRNDGSNSWKKGETGISYVWQRVKDDFEAFDSKQAEELASGSVTALPKNVGPGEEITLEVKVAASAAGAPLAALKATDMLHYSLAWTLLPGKKQEAVPAGAQETVYITPQETGIHYVDSTTPKEMTAGREYPIELIVTNTGAEAWKANETNLTYRWFYWDGQPTPWKGRAPVTAAVAPGDSAQLSAAVKAPPYEGAYSLLWDISRGDEAAFDGIDGRETLHLPVMVTEGLCRAVNLTDAYNIIAGVSERRSSSGDFDGLGNSFPVEILPPDLSGNASELYPSGYYAAPSEGEPLDWHKIAFRYPAKNSGLSRAVACLGQSVALPSGKISRLHILGTGTGASLTGSFVLTYADSRTQNVPLTMSFWLSPPAQGEAVGFVAPYIRGPKGDNLRQPAYINHYVMVLPEPAELTSLALPDNKEMKIFAISAESPAE